jgi:hypothetical protein
MDEGTARMGDTTPGLTNARRSLIPGTLVVEAMLMSRGDGEKVEYFYNTSTKMVEKGRLSSWEHLMGPYDSYEDAERALETAAQRTQAWDDDDAQWASFTNDDD